MRKLTIEETKYIIENAPVVFHHPGMSEIIETIQILSSGESLVVTRKEWPGKSEPRQVLSRIIPNTVKTVSLKDKSGWVIVKR